MEKKYNNGLVLGKFFPVHTGHLYLIDTALENCKHVEVIVCSNKSQNIPGELRFNSIVEIYKNNPDITIHNFYDDGLPQSDTECLSKEEFYGLWIPRINDIVNNLDVVFTSENYGNDFAEYLGVEHYLVDKDRINYPISGTKIRSNPFKYWDFIPKEIKPFFTKKVAILGPESTGKSTLSIGLSDYFKTNYVEEYGRTLWEEKNGDLTLGDFLTISKERQKIENTKVKVSNKYLILDTEDITTYLFSKIYYPQEYKSIENNFINTPTYDVYILLSPDCEPVQDGTRNYLDIRDSHFGDIKNELENRKIKYKIIGGSWENRLSKSIDYIISETNP
jgi:HTH-type transcriptional repressor of NAD biosynthesis genes